jgi:hypothetical protein
MPLNKLLVDVFNFGIAEFYIELGLSLFLFSLTYSSVSDTLSAAEE